MESNTKPCYNPSLDFNKRLNVQSLNKKSGKHFWKSMINGLENRKLVSFVKVNCLWKTSVKGKKQYSSKTKDLIIHKLLNEFIQNEENF